jgi:hypothetical protein
MLRRFTTAFREREMTPLEELEMLAKDCEELAIDAQNARDEGLKRAHLSIAYRIRRATKMMPIAAATSPSGTRGELTKIAAECHRAKWQFDFNDENRLSVGMARDMVKRAFGELHRIGDMALKLRDTPPVSRPMRGAE